MGKTLDIFLGRRSSKLHNLLELCITRNSRLKNHQEACFFYFHSDVVQLLKLNHHQQALLRVERVIKSKNIAEAFAMIENYCHLLKEKESLIEESKGCPDELKEAIGGMLFASSRISDTDNPELWKIRDLFTSKFGEKFVSEAIESPESFGVDEKIMLKLSRRKPSEETQISCLREIASNNGINLRNLNAKVQQSRETQTRLMK